jgi:hypothetical protein
MRTAHQYLPPSHVIVLQLLCQLKSRDISTPTKPGVFLSLPVAAILKSVSCTTTIATAFMQKHLIHAGLRQQFQHLDHKCSTIFQEYLVQQDIAFPLVPPGIHCAKSAKRAIRTFMNHLLVGICSTDPDFPMSLWDRLLPQAIITLNLLRGSRINPKLSAHAQVFGQYSYYTTPIDPHILVH